MMAATLAPAQISDDAWVFSYFVGNGEDGLHLAWSDDGLSWKALAGGKPLFNARIGGERLMRDPCIIRGPDGRFHMVWTTGWRGKDIGYASSKDLIHWNGARAVPVMAHEPEALNCWAPELFYDERYSRYIIFWATTVPGRFPATDNQSDKGPPNPGLNHRLYMTTTRDFLVFTPTRLFYDHGFNVIDGTIARDGGRYVLFLKDESNNPFPAQKNIRMAFGSSADGPYGPPTEPITGDYWCEGPTVLRAGDEWIVLLDRYRERRMAGVRSSDLKHWEDISAQVAFPPGVRHGTALRIPRPMLDELLHLQ
jgi:hypothetical protein